MNNPQTKQVTIREQLGYYLVTHEGYRMLYKNFADARTYALNVVDFDDNLIRYEVKR